MLCLENLPNEAFYNCLDLEGSQISALHAAVFHFEYWKGKKPAHWVIHKVLERWNEPVHLNFQVAEGYLKGFTALHIVVKDANVPAVRYLFEEEGENLVLTHQDNQDMTVLDLALLSLRNQKPVIDGWDVPLEKQQEADEKHWANAGLTIGFLKNHGAMNNKFAQAIVRPEPNDLIIWDISSNHEVPTGPTIIKEAGTIFKKTPEELEDLPPLFRHAAKLDVGDAFWVLDPKYEKKNTVQAPGLTANESLFTPVSQQLEPQPREMAESWRWIRTGEESLTGMLESIHLGSRKGKERAS